MDLYPHFSFSILHQDRGSQARTGLLKTPHGVIETPNFIFCATKAAMKGATPQTMLEAHTQIILANTYHLMLQPGAKQVRQLGGLHQLMGWQGPLLTDSGGFQIFSLGHGSVANEIKGKRTGRSMLLKVREEGALFRSYIDGSTHWLTPEISIQIQKDLGADLILVLDECTPFHVDQTYTETSMHLSHRWALRSLEEFKLSNNGCQALYGIVQGGIYPSLRKLSATFIHDHPFFGQAVGGSLGASKVQMHAIVGATLSLLDKKKPVHLLGIGGISDIFNGVKYGVDTFDCVHPTRLARHAGALIPAYLSTPLNLKKEHINLKNSYFKLDANPIDPTCLCYTCQHFSRGYLHHLFKANEMLGPQALTIHNVYFMNRLMTTIREAIFHDKLAEVESQWCI